MMVLNTELKSTNRILVYVRGELRNWRIKWSPMLTASPVCPVSKLQGSCDVLQVIQHQSLDVFNDYRCLGDEPVVTKPCDGFLRDQDEGGAFEARENLPKLHRSVEDLREDQGQLVSAGCQPCRGHIVKSWSLSDLQPLKELLHILFSDPQCR